MEINVNDVIEHYEKCRVLVKLLCMSREIDVDDDDIDAMVWLLEENFEKLGEQLKINQRQ